MIPASQSIYSFPRLKASVISTYNASPHKIKVKRQNTEYYNFFKCYFEWWNFLILSYFLRAQKLSCDPELKSKSVCFYW